jgi:hypothetical protein
MSSIRDQISKTAQGYMDGLNNPGDEASGVIAHRTPDCVQRLLPSALNMPPHTNEQYRAFMKQSGAFVTRISFVLAEGRPLMIDETARKVLLHILSDGDTVFGPYNNEYFIILTTTEDGSQITEVTEFLDTQRFTSFIQAVQGAAQAAPKQHE